MYAITLMTALRSVDSMLFHVCFFFVNTWTSVRMGSNAGHYLVVLYIIFVYIGACREM